MRGTAQPIGTNAPPAVTYDLKKAIVPTYEAFLELLSDDTRFEKKYCHQGFCSTLTEDKRVIYCPDVYVKRFFSESDVRKGNLFKGYSDTKISKKLEECNIKLFETKKILDYVKTDEPDLLRRYPLGFDGSWSNGQSEMLAEATSYYTKHFIEKMMKNKSLNYHYAITGTDYEFTNSALFKPDRSSKLIVRSIKPYISHR